MPMIKGYHSFLYEKKAGSPIKWLPDFSEEEVERNGGFENALSAMPP